MFRTLKQLSKHRAPAYAALLAESTSYNTLAASSSLSANLIATTSSPLLNPLRTPFTSLLLQPFSSNKFSTSAQTQNEPSSGLQISDNAVEKLKELQHSSPQQGVVLRLSVEGGGCSGFQYAFTLENEPKKGDRIFERDGVTVVSDDVSLEFLQGCTIDYESDLMRSSFVVSSNPNAELSCGCGSSFSATK